MSATTGGLDLTADDRALVAALFNEARGYQGTDRVAWMHMWLPGLVAGLSRQGQGVVLATLAELA
jgi:hypothetical protein